MLLRRITKHVKDQNWFAVLLDFFIVVVGILIAFQITNWSEGRSEAKLETYYLERLQSDLSETIDYLSSRQKLSEEILYTIDAFVVELNNPNARKDELVLATTTYVIKGTILLDFKVNRTTFDDLSRTGNLKLLSNNKLTEALVQLNTNYAGQNEDLLVNTDWVLSLDNESVSEFDFFQFDELTQHLFPKKPVEETAADIRESEDLLRRHAALHFWFADNVKGNYAKMIEQSQSVLDMVEADLEKK